MSNTTVVTPCPFCMQQHDFSRSFECPETGEIVPDDFFDAEPIYLLTIGFSRHGKSVYVSALTLMLEEISMVWRRVTIDYLDEHTRLAVQGMRYLDRRNQQPNLNPVSAPRPLLMRINNLPKVGTRNLVIYDVGGELFTKPEELHSYIPALSQVKTCWFFISLKDLYSDENINTLGDLFASYAKSMQRLNAPLEHRKLTVVYTKADEIKFTADIDRYIQNDPLRELTNRYAQDFPTSDDFVWNDYIKELHDQSAILRTYTEKKLRGGAAFIDRAENAHMHIEFSAVSALGAGTDENGRMSQQVARYRVLDPFLWAILFNIEEEETPVFPPTKAITLVLDASDGGRSFFEDNLPTSLVAQLGGANAGVQTYFLGQSTIAARAGQGQPTQPPKIARPLLIGPVFEAIAKTTQGDRLPCVVVVTHKPILDMNDYRTTSWLENVLLVTPEQQEGDWDQFLYQGMADLPSLSMAVKRKFALKTR